MAKTACRILGTAFLLAGVAGFFNPHLLGFHLTTVHNLVHLATAAAALYFGFPGTLSGARGFSLGFGAVYALLGILGFAAPDLVTAILMHPPVAPGELIPDNLFHIVVGGAFLAAGLATSTAQARPAHA
jgi:hypothetical protein